jgi:hypothetical protein
MYDKNWHILDIDCGDAILPGVDIRDLSYGKPEGVHAEGYAQWASFTNENFKYYFSLDWVNKIENVLGIKLDAFMIFNTDANRDPPTAHVDYTEPHISSASIYGFNFVPYGQNSTMEWFKPKSGTLPESQRALGKTNADTLYKYWEIHELEQIDSVSIKNKLTLVRTNIPHAVRTGNEPRWSVSFRSADSSIKTWEDAIDRFKHLI